MLSVDIAIDGSSRPRLQYTLCTTVCVHLLYIYVHWVQVCLLPAMAVSTLDELSEFCEKRADFYYIFLTAFFFPWKSFPKVF